MTRPPYFSRLRSRYWKNKDGTKISGISFLKGGQIVAHLTPSEAIELANQLVDIAERMEES